MLMCRKVAPSGASAVPKEAACCSHTWKLVLLYVRIWWKVVPSAGADAEATFQNSLTLCQFCTARCNVLPRHRNPSAAEDYRRYAPRLLDSLIYASCFIGWFFLWVTERAYYHTMFVHFRSPASISAWHAGWPWSGETKGVEGRFLWKQIFLVKSHNTRLSELQISNTQCPLSTAAFAFSGRKLRNLRQGMWKRRLFVAQSHCALMHVTAIVMPG